MIWPHYLSSYGICLVSRSLGIKLDREIIGEPIPWAFGYFCTFYVALFLLLKHCICLGVRILELEVKENLKLLLNERTFYYIYLSGGNKSVSAD